MRGNVACDKRVAVLQGIAPPVIFKEKSKTHHFGGILDDVSDLLRFLLGKLKIIRKKTCLRKINYFIAIKKPRAFVNSAFFFE